MPTSPMTPAPRKPEQGEKDKSRSAKRRRMSSPVRAPLPGVGEVEMELEDGALDEEVFDPAKLAKEADEAFGRDTSYAGYRVYAGKGNRARSKLMEKFLLWLVFATAHEHDHQFGPNNCYDSKSFLAVTNFVTQQWQVRPLQIERHPSPGRTIRYLLTFEAEVAPQLLQILPRDWIKLAKGLGCRFRSPARALPPWQNMMCSGVPFYYSQKDLEEVVVKENILKITVFTRIKLENGVATDRVHFLAMFADSETAYAETITREFKHQGCVLRLERRQACSTCGEDDHIQSACGLKLRLQSPEMQEWAYVPVTASKSSVAKSEKELEGRAPKVVVVPTNKTVAVVVDGEGSGSAKLPEDGKRPAKKRKGNKGKKGKN